MSNEGHARSEIRARWRADGWYSSSTIGGAIDRAGRNWPDVPIVLATKTDQHRLTLGSIVERARCVAGGLVARGVNAGDRVVVRTPHPVDNTVAAAAVWLAGGVVVPIVPFATEEEVGDLIERSGAAMVLGSSDVAELETGPGTAPVQVEPSSAACIIFTSGSTSVPKGVVHSHETLLAGLNVDSVEPAETVTLSTFPPGHVASAIGAIRMLTGGGATVLMDRWSASLAAALIEEHGVTASAGTPFYLSTLLDEAEASGRDVSSLKAFLVGAASVPPALVERAARAGIISWRTYGSTEHPAISSGMPTDCADDRTNTDGKVSPGNEVRIVDEEGNDLPLGEEGEILSRGPKQFLGYLDPTLDAEAFDGTWFRTGDVGRLRVDGHLTITDRKKDIIIRGGENISAKEVEDVLARHPAVSEVAVVAGPDETWGERVVAFVSLRPEAALDLEAAREQVASCGLAAHKAPTFLQIVEDFPRTSSGKIRKVDLRRRLVG